MGFEGEEDDCCFADRGQVVGALRMRRELFIAVTHRDPAILHGGKMGTSRDEDHVLPAAREMGAEVTTDGAGADDGDFHLGLSVAATERRWTFPVAVVGIRSTM